MSRLKDIRTHLSRLKMCTHFSNFKQKELTLAFLHNTCFQITRKNQVNYSNLEKETTKKVDILMLHSLQPIQEERN
jgi:hypothetical protein